MTFAKCPLLVPHQLFEGAGTPFLHVSRNLVSVSFRFRSRSYRIGKRMHIGNRQLRQAVEGFLEVLVGFPGKTADYVGTDPAIWNCPVDFSKSASRTARPYSAVSCATERRRSHFAMECGSGAQMCHAPAMRSMSSSVIDAGSMELRRKRCNPGITRISRTRSVSARRFPGRSNP